MKARLTSVISLAGVLVAGSAAALVNTQVLQNSSPSRVSRAVEFSTTTPTPTPTTVADGPVAATVAPESTLAPTGAPTEGATQADYRIGDAGVVTLDTAGEALSIVSVTPSSGWVVVDAEQEDLFHVEVGFRSGNLLVEFHASYLFGVVVTSMESEVVSAASADRDSGSTATTDTDDVSNGEADDEEDGEEHDDD